MIELIYDGSPIKNIISAEEDKQLGGNWTIDISLVKDTAPDISLGDDITIHSDVVTDTNFFITDMGERREEEERYLNLTLAHNIFKLEAEAVKEEYTYHGNVVEHVERILEYQEGEQFNAEVEPSMSGSDQEKFLDLTAELEIDVGNMYKAFKYIIEQFYARFRPEGNTIYLMPEYHINYSTLSFEYGLNNQNIQRNYSHEKVIGTLVAEAWLRGEVIDGVVDPTVIKEYGSGTPVRHKDFGSFSYEGALDEVAHEYLQEHQIPEAEYDLSVVDLLRMNEDKRPEGVSTVEIDVGLSCDVEDAELGIDDILKIQRVQRSLLSPEEPVNLTIGKIREDHLEEFKDEVIQTKKEQERREPRLYTNTDPDHSPDPEKGKDGDVFVRPQLEEGE